MGKSGPNLPCSLDAERAVLGAMLIGSPNAGAAFDLLAPDDFFTPTNSKGSPHRIIFEAMVEMHTRQQAIDLLTLTEELTRRDQLEAAGGAAYLAQLLDGVPSVTNVEYYARIVQEKAQLRRLAYAGAAIELAALERGARAGDVLSQLSEYASTLARRDGLARRVSDVKSECVEWLWLERIPLSKLTILDGDPGVGKSLVAVDLAARVTRGAAMPDGTSAVDGGAVVLSAEDGLADTIRPRLEAAGADLKRILCVGSDEALPTIPSDLSRIETLVRAVRAVIVIIDPLIAFIPGETNTWRDQDIRRALAPLARMAERTGAAVLLLRHLNKSSGGNALYRGGGSIGIIGAARCALLIARDPDDQALRVLAATKSNLALPPPSISFRLEGNDSGAVRVAWGGQSSHDASELLVQAVGPEERSALDAARAVLRAVLADGPVEAVEVRRQARTAGIAGRTLDRAKFIENVVARREGFGAGARWVWQLPKDAKSLTKSANNQDLASFEQVPDTKPVDSAGSAKSAKTEILASFDEGLALFGDAGPGAGRAAPPDAAQGCATPTQPDCGCAGATVCPRCWLCPAHCHCQIGLAGDGQA